MNPVMTVKVVQLTTGVPTHRSCYVWCPGCEQIHPFRVRLDDGTARTDLPLWEWDGNETAPTFSPSLLVHGSVHLCPDEHLVECPGRDCGHLGHRKKDGRLYTVGPHTVDPARGDCHSFLRGGVWEFLDDSAHALAGRSVPVEALPDWWCAAQTR